MFRLHRVSTVVRVPPDRYSEPLEKVASDLLKNRFEGATDPSLGLIVAVTDVSVSDVGKILPSDGATYHQAECTLLTFTPEVQEVVEGEVIDITDFGAFVRLGPIDALVHISQIIDDALSYDKKKVALMGKETHRTLQKGDLVRARVITVSMGSEVRMPKIGLTMRQPFLGSLPWIAEDVKKLRERVKRVEA